MLSRWRMQEQQSGHKGLRQVQYAFLELPKMAEQDERGAISLAHREGRDEGRHEGRAEARAHDVLTVLRARGLAGSDAARERILAQKNPARLERWLERAAVAASLAEVIDDPS